MFDATMAFLSGFATGLLMAVAVRAAVALWADRPKGDIRLAGVESERDYATAVYRRPAQRDER